MSLSKIIFISLSLATDAFAASICKGICLKKITLSNIFIIGLYFGLFQSVMPLIGYFISLTFKDLIINIDHWLAFILLFILGFNLLKEAKNYDEGDDKLDFCSMFFLAIATSIDALAIGITFAFLKVDIILPIVIIGLITFILSVIGVIIGHRFGNHFQTLAKVVGGIILIFIGFKILSEHLHIIN